MTVIEGLGWTGPVQGGRRVQAGTSGFAVSAETAATAGAERSVEVAPAELGLLLGLQEWGGAEERDRKALRHGQDMLALLADMQRLLLAGADTTEALNRLAALAGGMPPVADPRLMAVVRAIAMRIWVEIARCPAGDDQPSSARGPDQNPSMSNR
jgi:hypothetical protein